MRPPLLERTDPRALAKFLAWFTILYNLAEGVVSIGFGQGEDSYALMGFGLDSLIEVSAAFLVLWRLKSDFGEGDPLSLDKERKGTLTVGVLFVGLALAIAGFSLAQLAQGGHPRTTWPNLAISLLSLAFMYALWQTKLDVARRLDSQVLAQDAACSKACFQLSWVLFAGGALFLISPLLWWADSVAALGLSVLIFLEGTASIQAARAPEFTGGCGCGGGACAKD